MKKVIHDYFHFFETKNIEGFNLLLADSVHLKDWSLDVVGKTNVLSALNQIFVSFDDIKIRILEIYQDQSVFIIEIMIVFDCQTELSVVDIIRFDSDGRICAVNAYKR
jgi:hypothetical protein